MGLAGKWRFVDISLGMISVICHYFPQILLIRIGILIRNLHVSFVNDSMQVLVILGVLFGMPVASWPCWSPYWSVWEKTWLLLDCPWSTPQGCLWHSLSSCWFLVSDPLICDSYGQILVIINSKIKPCRNVWSLRAGQLDISI